MTEVIWLLLLVPLAASLGSQLLVRSTYRRYRSVPNHAGLAGAEIARALLDAHGLQRVTIRPAPGSLSDNYDGERKRLSLSNAVATERTVSAMASPRTRSRTRIRTPRETGPTVLAGPSPNRSARSRHGSASP